MICGVQLATCSGHTRTGSLEQKQTGTFPGVCINHKHQVRTNFIGQVMRCNPLAVGGGSEGSAWLLGDYASSADRRNEQCQGGI